MTDKDNVSALLDATDLTLGQDAFLVAFLATSSIRDAATETGISESTAYRWLRDATFLSAYQQAKHMLYTMGISQLQASVGKATEVLTGQLDNISPKIQIQAAKILLDNAIVRTTKHEVAGIDGAPIQIGQLLNQYFMIEKEFLTSDEVDTLKALGERIEERKKRLPW